MDAFEERNVAASADSVRARLRNALHDIQASHGAEGRSYRGLDHSMMVTYALESFMRALTASERGRSFVLKGGNLFRIWDGGASFRPTGDLDMQCTDEARDFEDVRDLRQEVSDIVCTRAFREETGLVFDMDQFKLDRIRKGWLVAYRLEGKAWLGPPGVDNVTASEVPFCLEVTYGPPPEGAVEPQRWTPLTARSEPFDIVSSRPEWMASEKFHSVSTRGMGNGRLKDYRDLSILLGRERFDDQMLHRCIRQVFQELRQEGSIPETATGMETLSQAFATSHNEGMWQLRRWREWEGRDFNPATDPTLRETVAVVLVSLERKGVLNEPAAGRGAKALADLVREASDLAQRGVTAPAAGRFATALKSLAAVAAEDPAALAWRWVGHARAAGAAGVAAGDAFASAVGTAAELGMSSAIDRGWDRGRGGGGAALAALQASLRAGDLALAGRQQEKKVSAVQEPQRPADPGAIPADERARPDRRRGRRPEADAGAAIRSGLMLLSQGEPGSHTWFGGLAKVLSAPDAEPPENITGIILEVPEDERAPAVWARISKKAGLLPLLDDAVAEARRILRMDGPMPGISP